VNEPSVQFETPRLIVRVATSDDASFITSLWSDLDVMRHVGFPRGIPTAAEDVPRRIERGKGLNALLVARLRANGEPIGQCMLGTPDSFGVCEPDIKLAPTFWGHGYGRELWAALIDQLFRHSACATHGARDAEHREHSVGPNAEERRDEASRRRHLRVPRLDEALHRTCSLRSL
jgi:RimJ/RimL family protein N-acetyltransferase